MFKGLTKTEIITVVGSSILGAMLTAWLDVVNIKSNHEKIREAVKAELAEENEVEPQ